MHYPPFGAMITPLAVLIVAAAAVHAQPRDTVRIDTGRGGRVWIEGSSNVHDWSCKASTFDAHVELAQPSGAAAEPETLAAQIRRVRVKVSVRDLKCGNRKMERDLYAALKATDPANPSFIIASFNTVPGSTQPGVIETQGTLTVAGVERYVDTRIATELLVDGSVKARGSVPLLMTDFGVKPPVGLLGLIRSRNEVVVKFELIVGAAR